MKRLTAAAVLGLLGAALAAVAACTTFGSDTESSGGTDSGGPNADGASTDAIANGDARSPPDDDAAAFLPSPCLDGGGSWLCDDFDRPSPVAPPPRWTSVEENNGGALTLDDRKRRSYPNSLSALASKSNAIAVLHADKSGTLAGGLRCAFDLFIEASGPSNGKARIFQMKLKRGFNDYVIVELKVQSVTHVLEHGALVTVDGGAPQIIPAVTFTPVSNGWHAIGLTLRGLSYTLNVDDKDTTVTLSSGSSQPFTSAELTFGVIGLDTTDPWRVDLDNIACDPQS